ncbi:MAG: PASTA domain-containing protein [Oscillospiraceae bacterium]|jgi:stage V sporulation protein D (sporulation-specific penicillin-binding protein)|nr:PASTA domain-containing protein [Oscillospiraceae bacterium]
MAKGTTIRMWRRSILVLTALIVFGFGTIVFRLMQLQIIQGKNLQQMAIDQQLKDTLISAKRGTIYDRNMKPLVQSATVWKVVLEPAYIKTDEKKEIISSGLSEILGIPKEEIYEKANKKSYYSILEKKVESEIKDKIVEFQSKNKIRNGIRIIEDYKRYYTFKTFASNVLGFTGSDNQGLSGIENYYDKELNGESGRLITARNAVGTNMPFEYEQRIEPKNGNSLVLTIDESIQRSIEKHLEEGRINNKAVNGATSIMMDVNNGEILGMAVKKDFNPNSPFEIEDEEVRKKIEELPADQRSKEKGKALEKQWRNKAISDAYMPGSTFKILTSSMALEENLVNDETRFNCNGSIVPYNKARSINCHKHSGHGVQNFQQIICNSCNPAFVSLGQMLGPEIFFKYYKNFGLTQKTGIDLPGEANGIFFNKDGSMAPMDLAVASFGQNFTITPIQMLSAVASIVNGGKWIQPHVTKQIIDEKGNIIKKARENMRRRVISEATSKKICKLLQVNVDTGSGKNGGVPGYDLGGKTGTSEKIGDSEEGKKDYIGSYCCFGPTESPKFVLIVIYDTPRGNSYYGGIVAAPVGAKIVNDTFPILGVNKNYKGEELEKLDTTTPFLVGSSLENAKSVLLQNELKPIIKGDGTAVVSQIPSIGAKIPKGGTVVLYTDNQSAQRKIKVPDFLGLSIASANRLAVSSELNMSIFGTAQSREEIVASKQSIPKGELVDPGTVVTVEFVQKDTIN